MWGMQFAEYEKKYRPRVLEIFRSNCPKYFNTHDENNLINFLDNYADQNYLVVFENEEIIGCGGHYTKEESHGIAWSMFERNAIGPKKLLASTDRFYAEIEARILQEEKFYNIYINTTQLMERLFQRYGYNTYEVIQHGFGKGLHEYKMRKQLSSSC